MYIAFKHKSVGSGKRGRGLLELQKLKLAVLNANI